MIDWIKWKLGKTKFNGEGYCYHLNVNGTISTFKNIRESIKTFNRECDRLKIQCGMITRDEAELRARLSNRRDQISSPNTNLYYKEYDFVDSVTGMNMGFVELTTLRR